MKKIFLLTALLLIGVHAKSQVLISILLGDKLNTGKIEFGLDGGLNLSDIEGLQDGDIVGRFNIGFYFDFKLKNPAWMIHTGVLVKSTMGAKNLPVYSLNNPDLDDAFTGGKVERRLNYFNVPIMAKYLFKNHFSVEAGPVASLMGKATDIFSKEVKDKDDLTYKLKIRDDYHPLDFGMMVGLGYRLMGGNGMNLGIRYYVGLVDITIDDSTADQYNRALYFAVGIPIGRGKKEAKQTDN